MTLGFPSVRVLVLIPGRQVEALQASPLIRTLAAGLEELTVMVACSPVAGPVARGLEGVTDVLPLRGLDPTGTLFDWLVAWVALRRRRFDVALVCGHEARARLLAFLIGVPRRLGPSGGLTSFLLSDHVPDRQGENRSAVWLRLAHLLGVTAERHAPRFEPGPDAAQEALVQLHSTGIADGRLMVAMAPGAGFTDVDWLEPASLTWDAERWAHLANQLAARHGAGILFIGTVEDEQTILNASVDVAAPHRGIAGELDIAGTAALLGLCDLVISGDTPLLHLASAVGTSAVGLFGPTNGRRRGPYGDQHRVIQAIPGPPPPRQRVVLTPPEPLMGRIRVEDVLAGIETSL
jgi:heptosyltransferase II